MTQGADPYGLQPPGGNFDPSAGRGLPNVGYPAYDPITGQPLTSGYPAPYPGAQGYSPAPYPAAPPPVYPVAGQLPNPYQAGYPGQYPPGMQMVPMYAGYPMVPARPSRPGGAVAAAVLAFVQGGFVLIGSLFILTGSEMFNDLNGYGSNSLSSEFTLVGIVTLIAGGLLIAGGATVLSRRSAWLVAGSLASLAISVYFAIRISGIRYADFGLWVPLVFAVLPIISLALTMSGDVRNWIRQR